MEYVVGGVVAVAIVILAVWAWFQFSEWLDEKTSSPYEVQHDLKILGMERELRDIKAHFGGMQSTNDKRDHRLRHRMWGIESGYKSIHLNQARQQDTIDKLVLKVLELEGKIEEVREDRPQPDGDSDSDKTVGSNGRLTLRSGGRSS